MMRLVPLITAVTLACLSQMVMADAKQDAELMDRAFRQQDYETSFRIARKLAEMGNAEGQMGLSAHYLEGLGGAQKDEERATFWLHKAAQQGDEFAISMMLMKYSSGGGGAPKHSGYERDVWIRRMANQGDLAAQRYIEEQKKPSAFMNKVRPGYRSPWHDPNYAVEKD